MLVLSRREQETLVIGDDVRVTVVSVRGDKVRLGVEAPDHVSIHRLEVYDAIREKLASSEPTPTGEARRKKVCSE